MNDTEGTVEGEAAADSEDLGAPPPEVTRGQHTYYYVEASGLEEVMEGCTAKGLKFLGAKRYPTPPAGMLEDIAKHKEAMTQKWGKSPVPRHDQLGPAYAALTPAGMEGAKAAGLKGYVQGAFVWRVKGIRTAAYTPAQP